MFDSSYRLPYIGSIVSWGTLVSCLIASLIKLFASSYLCVRGMEPLALIQQVLQVLLLHLQRSLLILCVTLEGGTLFQVRGRYGIAPG